MHHNLKEFSSKELSIKFQDHNVLFRETFSVRKKKGKFEKSIQYNYMHTFECSPSISFQSYQFHLPSDPQYFHHVSKEKPQVHQSFGRF